jgi:serine/threonine-protein kinase
MSSMTPDDWQAVTRIFHAALEHPEETREAYVQAETAGNETLAGEVRSLLAFHERAGDWLDVPSVDLSVEGQMVGPYRILRDAGEGGMGIVYLAEDTRLGRTVALKAIPAAWTHDGARRERLRHEARAAAALSHPGVAVIYALEDIDGQLFLSSEFVRGNSLREELRHGPIPVSALLRTAQDLADALAAAHDRGIVHRDLKPENIMRTPDGRVKIIDFGIAGFGDGDNEMAGTPAYMAPEQLTGGPVDVRADQYAFGILLHELATGQHPFSHGGPRIPLDATHPQLAGLDAVIARCLAASAEERYPTTRALVEALARVAASIPAAGSAPVGTVAPPARAMSPLWWWQFHQLITSVGYGVALYFLWVARDYTPGPVSQWLFLAGLAGSLTANTLRLHLWFTSRFYPEEWQTQRRAAWVWTRLGDFVFGATLLLSSARHLETQPDLSALFIGSAIMVLIAFAIIEPATTRAAARQMP